jgi:hypothetical protein
LVEGCELIPIDFYRRALQDQVQADDDPQFVHFARYRAFYARSGAQSDTEASRNLRFEPRASVDGVPVLRSFIDKNNSGGIVARHRFSYPVRQGFAIAT